MSKIKQFLIVFVFTLSFSSALFAFDLDLHEGDIIGESELIEDSSTAYIEAATMSRFGHVGLVLKENNELVVYEEYPPNAQIVSVDEFLGRLPGKFAVIRSSLPLLRPQLDIIQKTADLYVKNQYPYNYSQIINNSSMNCSEFMHFLFSQIGMKIGKIQQIKDMNLKAFTGLPWLLWRTGDPQISKTDAVITPKSVMQSEGFKKVYGELNPEDNLSDGELYQQWKSENATHAVAKEWYIFEKELYWMSKY